jgi:Domain of unknown function (DUF4873)
VTEQPVHGVVLVGDSDAANELLAAGIHDFMIFDREVVSSVFDDDTDTWTLAAEDGETCRGRVVVACESPFVPLVPDLLGRRDFRGTAMHAAMPAAYFDPAGKRVVVIGADSIAGELIERMASSGARIKVFPLAPRRAVPRLRRGIPIPRRRRIEVISSPIEEVTAVGVRTVDGAHHDADAIVYGTGFAVRAGLPEDTLVGSRGISIQQAWTDGAEPYLGVAVHNFPNYFTLNGPDFAAGMRYIVGCLQLLGRHHRIEVRRSAQRVFNERLHLRRPSWELETSAFELSSAAEVQDDSYDGPAMLRADDAAEHVRVALTGHIEPIDGQYHWQGTVFDAIPAELVRARELTVTVGERTAAARITEQTPQGTHSIAGVGAPPYPLAHLQFT